VCRSAFNIELHRAFNASRFAHVMGLKDTKKTSNRAFWPQPSFEIYKKPYPGSSAFYELMTPRGFMLVGSLYTNCLHGKVVSAMQILDFWLLEDPQE
jgi:hypothetical protein